MEETTKNSKERGGGKEEGQNESREGLSLVKRKKKQVRNTSKLIIKSTLIERR